MRIIFFTVNNEGGVGFVLLALQTDRQTDGRTYTLTDVVILIPMVYNTLWLLE